MPRRAGRAAAGPRAARACRRQRARPRRVHAAGAHVPRRAARRGGDRPHAGAAPQGRRRRARRGR
ncbi:MAG: hypothetical protein DMD88_16800 [Candidatus Rokuibacteriota bacterium]|nr:MAG: hypothetical protein DMD88_16800 [Candidatus Rokubacteria bacterium]